MSFDWNYIHRELKCEKNFEKLFHGNGGIFYGDISIERVLPFTLVRLTLFFTISQSLHYIFKPLKQVEYVSNIMAGIILGPSVLGKYREYNNITDNASHVNFINVMAYVGLLYHVFIVAVKTDSAMVLRFRKKYWIMGISSMFAQFLIMLILLIILHPISAKQSMYIYVIALQISTTWFINLVSVIEELNLLTTEFGQLSLSLALTNEFMMWVCAFGILFRKTSKFELVKMISPLLTMMLLIFGIVRPTLLWIIKRLPRGQPVKDTYIIFTLLGAGIIACICDILVGSPLMGIIFIGLVVPHGPPLGLAIVERGETFVKTCLLPFFFLGVGYSVNFDFKDLKAQALYQLIIIIGHLTKTLTVTMCAMWYNLKPQQGFALGVIMNTSGIVHAMSYWSQWTREKTDNYIFSQLIISSVVVTSIATPLALYFHKQSRKDSNSIRGFHLSVQSALMSSKMHVLVCIDNEDDITGFMNLIKASNPTESHPINVYIVHLVELVGQAAPMLVPHKKHNRLCSYNGCVHISNAMNSFYDDISEGGLTVQLLTMIAPFASIYESICKLAEEKMIPLVIVPFIYKSLNHFGISASSQLNCKLQQQTPCTLGIFVNKGTSNNKKLNLPHFTYNVAVIFCGGEDDREVLTYANRMSTHPGVSITMLRIFVQEYYDHKNEDEILLDNSVVEKFKDNIINNNNECYLYEEFHIEEWLQTINVVESHQKSYDLVMVGRRHGQQVLLEDDLYVLSENPELGEIGELIFSGDIQWENTSFLVMQHCMGVDREPLGNVVFLDDS
ncbi:hypothetical protein RND81_11G089300 [Saponaria officinalis]|uniref:Cation/H+ exchanger domain-containing protein n=1 Tax=Saponaria officinalis TaxID=3572 RepID=A0AAW1HJW0_SAPOF